MSEGWLRKMAVDDVFGIFGTDDMIEIECKTAIEQMMSILVLDDAE